MKLNEIIDTNISNFRTNTRFDNARDQAAIKNRINTDTHESGLISKDAKVANDPHMHQKWNRLATTDLENKDPYWIYVNSIIKNKWFDSNPHFPRIYDVKTYTDSDGNEKKKVMMETLHPILSLDDEMLVSIIENNFSESSHGNNTHRPQRLLPKLMLAAMFDPSIVTNETLRDACRIIARIKNRNSLQYDLHIGNVMVRYAHGTPQLVITDPFRPDSDFIRKHKGLDD